METLQLYYELADWLVMFSFITKKQPLKNIRAPILKNYHYGNISFKLTSRLLGSIFLLNMWYPSIYSISVTSLFSPLLAVQTNHWSLLSMDFTSQQLGWGNPFSSHLKARPLRKFCKQQRILSLCTASCTILLTWPRLDSGHLHLFQGCRPTGTWYPLIQTSEVNYLGGQWWKLL